MSASSLLSRDDLAQVRTVTDLLGVLQVPDPLWDAFVAQVGDPINSVIGSYLLVVHAGLGLRLWLGGTKGSRHGTKGSCGFLSWLWRGVRPWRTTKLFRCRKVGNRRICADKLLGNGSLPWFLVCLLSLFAIGRPLLPNNFKPLPFVVVAVMGLMGGSLGKSLGCLCLSLRFLPCLVSVGCKLGSSPGSFWKVV